MCGNTERSLNNYSIELDPINIALTLRYTFNTRLLRPTECFVLFKKLSCCAVTTQCVHWHVT